MVAAQAERWVGICDWGISWSLCEIEVEDSEVWRQMKKKKLLKEDCCGNGKFGFVGGGGGKWEVRRKNEKEENNEFVRAEMNPTHHLRLCHEMMSQLAGQKCTNPSYAK